MKVDSETGKQIPYAGAAFHLYDANGQRVVMKYTYPNNSVGGAVIGLFRPDETEFTRENALMIDTSDASGAFSFENVVYGHWIIAEIEQPEGFILTLEVHHIRIPMMNWMRSSKKSVGHRLMRMVRLMRLRTAILLVTSTILFLLGRKKKSRRKLPCRFESLHSKID